MSIEKLELYTVVSKGQIANGFNSQQVNANIQTRFKLDDRQVHKILSKGTVLKNNIGISGAQKLYRNFLKLGLITEFHANICAESELYLIKNRDTLELKQIQKKINKAINSYFSGSFTSHRLMLLKATTDPKLKTLNLPQTIDWLSQNLVSYKENQKLHTNAKMRYKLISLAACYLTADIKIDPSKFYLENLDLNDIETKNATELKRTHKIRVQQEQIDAIFYQRINLTIKQMPDDKQKRCKAVISVIQKISNLNETMCNLSYGFYNIDALLEYQQQQNEEVKKLKPIIKQLSKYCAQDIHFLLRASEKITDLIDTRQNKNLNQIIVSKTGPLPSDLSSLNPYQLVRVSQNVLNALKYQYVWLFGELVTFCKSQEKTMAIQPIKLTLMNENN